MTEGKFIPGNQSPATPDLSETELRSMQMQQLIDLAQQEGITDIDHMRRDDLIRAISAVHRQRRQQSVGAGSQQAGSGGGQEQASGGQAQSGGQEQASGGQAQSGSQQQASGGQQRAGAQQAGGGGQSQGRESGQPGEGKFIPGNQSPATPDLSESELRSMQMPQLQEIARQEGIQGIDQMRREDLIKAISARHREQQLHPQA